MIAATGQDKVKKGFEPIPEGFVHIPFNDIEALKEAITDKTAAVMLELIQGEGGINVASPGYVRELRRICDREKILMIVDEVQTGMGRTGHYFAYQAYGIEPDVMTLAKALGGGVAIGAFIVKNAFAHLLPPGTHASTFGGNPLACAAALAVFSVMKEEKILSNVSRMADRLRRGLKELQEEFPLIREVRGMGVMVGVELAREGKEVVGKALEKGLIINCTAGKVLRLMPAMNVTRNEVDQALAIMRQVLGKITNDR